MNRTLHTGIATTGHTFRSRIARIVTAFYLLTLSAAALAHVVTIPIHISTPSSVTGGNNFTTSVGIGSATSENGTVLVSTTRPDILASPTGSWPYTLTVPANTTSGAFSVSASSVSSSQNATMVTCATNEDISNPNNWRATCSVTVNP